MTRIILRSNLIYKVIFIYKIFFIFSSSHISHVSISLVFFQIVLNHDNQNFTKNNTNKKKKHSKQYITSYLVNVLLYTYTCVNSYKLFSVNNERLMFRHLALSVFRETTFNKRRHTVFIDKYLRRNTNDSDNSAFKPENKYFNNEFNLLINLYMK